MGGEGRVAGYLFKLIRERLTRTQQQLAEDLGVSLATVQGWESGRRPLMAMPAGTFLALRARLRAMGAAPGLLEALPLALEADLLLGHALDTPHPAAAPGGHLLGSWVINRPFTVLIVWPLTGLPPGDLCAPGPPVRRRGPVPAGPALSADERRHIVAHLQAVAERADRAHATGLLLARQAYYLLGFDDNPDTVAWLADQYQADRRIVHPGRGWSQAWPLARSTASALTRRGDPEPMRAFIADQLDDEAGERANLNYWAFWTGDLPGQHHGDAFIVSTPVGTWHGQRLMRHLLDRLHGLLGFVELNVHTLHALVRLRPQLIADPSVAGELNGKIERLLDENLVSASARGELQALRYGIAMARRH